MEHAYIGQPVVIIRRGKQQAQRGVVESITDDDIANVRTTTFLVPCFFSEIREAACNSK